MLYIFVGKDKIGKKVVRQRIASRFGCTIIPKYTQDTTNKWKIRYKTSFGEWQDIEEEIDLSSAGKDNLDRYIYEVAEKHNIVLKGARYLHRADDPFLIYLESNPKAEDFLYDIKKKVGNDEAQIRYYIRREFIKQALENKSENYLLACMSEKVINQIEDLQADLKSKNKDVAEIKVVFIDGAPRVAKKNKTSWNTSPADYILNNSYKFLKITNWTCVADGSETFDEVKFNKMIDRQWSNVTHMLPIELSCFIIRPFSDAKNVGKYNVNDIFAKKMEEHILNIKKSIDEGSAKTRNIKFEKLDENGDTIFAQIANTLEKSQLILVDLREHRPNCYYEYGYAQALLDVASKQGKTVIGLIGVVKDPDDHEVNKDKACDDLNHQVEDIWIDLSESEKRKAFDVTQFAHYKYILSLNKVYTEIDANLDILEPAGREHSFESRIVDMLQLNFKGINAFMEK